MTTQLAIDNNIEFCQRCRMHIGLLGLGDDLAGSSLYCPLDKEHHFRYSKEPPPITCEHCHENFYTIQDYVVHEKCLVRGKRRGYPVLRRRPEPIGTWVVLKRNGKRIGLIKKPRFWRRKSS